MNTRQTLISAAAGLVLAVSLRAGAVVGATEFTQIANNIELVASYQQHLTQSIYQAQMIENQLKAYANQLQNTKQLNGLDWQNATQLLNQIGNTVQMTQQVAYAAGAEDQAFQALHTDYATFAGGIPGASDMAGKYKQWSQYNLDTANRAANTAGLTLKAAANEQARIAALKQAGANPQGQVQAIQAGTALTAELLDQMRQLKALIAVQIDSQARYQRIQEEKEAAATGKGGNVKQGDGKLPTGTPKTYGAMQ